MSKVLNADHYFIKSQGNDKQSLLPVGPSDTQIIINLFAYLCDCFEFFAKDLELLGVFYENEIKSATKVTFLLLLFVSSLFFLYFHNKMLTATRKYLQ